MSIYNTKYYQQINEEEGEQARRLADILVWKYQPKSVADVGCATGLYLKQFIDRGIKGHGVDYSAEAVGDEVLQIPRTLIEVVDIAKKPIKLRADLALCIEVLEHIPADDAKTTIKHLSGTANLIFFTAAQPGQGGVGHVNCQPKEYWEKLFAEYGFSRDKKDEDYIRTLIANGYHMGWLINNLMILKRQPTRDAGLQ